jgi:protein-L-isoaspartate(D-aspartate) O-methyltransferase
MSQLVNQLIEEGTLKSPHIVSAFQKIKREDFMLSETRDEAEGNYPLPIGCSQTISQPYTVAFMLELLQPQKHDKILDVGSGSGWTTALLTEIVGPDGRVFAIERILELKKFGENNVAKYFSIFAEGDPASMRGHLQGKSKNSPVQFLCSDKMNGWKDKSPFNRILVSAAARKIPQDLLDQLKVGGRLVIPIGPSRQGFAEADKSSQDIIVLEKKSEREYKETRYPGFVFVPLLTSH